MQGRFTSADEIWKDSHVGDPQSWNKYAYARNNPLKFIDPTGEAAAVTIETDEKIRPIKSQSRRALLYGLQRILG
jgi:hypothetical protein